MLYNQDMLDTITLVSFLIGVANYNENLTQSDKDDIMKSLDKQTNDILIRVRESLQEQNEMLEAQNKILNKILDQLMKGGEK